MLLVQKIRIAIARPKREWRYARMIIYRLGILLLRTLLIFLQPPRLVQNIAPERKPRAQHEVDWREKYDR